MAGIDNFTKLMLHCNGADASTTFTDDSDSGHTVTANGNSQIDTAQSVFGGASGLFDTSNSSRLTIPDSEDFNFGSGDFTIDFRLRLNSVSGSHALVTQWGGSGSNGSIYIVALGTKLSFFYSSNGSSETQLDSTFNSFAINTWYHIAIVRDGTNIRYFVDGVAYGTGSIGTTSINNSTRPFNISTYADGTGQPLDGWIDEVRVSKGIARWTSAFTPPTSEYTPDAEITINETVVLNDSETISTDPESITINENVLLNDSENIVIPTKYASKIVSYNPLIYVNDSDPATITKVDVTVPDTPVFTTEVLTGTKNAKDVSVNTTTEYAYVACADGLVVKVKLSDLTDQTIINLSDTDDNTTIDTLDIFNTTAVGTAQSTGEAYLIDERSMFSMDSDFHLIVPVEFQLDSDFKLLSAFRIDSDFQLIAENKFLIDTDFKLITAPVNEINPIVRDDFHVYLDSVELENTDLDLDSLQITFNEEQKKSVSFKLTRKHDDLNTTLVGNTRQITNQNNIEVKIKGVSVFTGKISKIDPNYALSTDQVDVTALGEIATGQYQNTMLSLPGKDEVLNLYHILLQNYSIDNEFIDPNEENPSKFNGVRISLGNEVTEHVQRYTDFDINGTDAEAIQNGSFVFSQLWTYFWSPTVKKFAEIEIKEETKSEEIADPTEPTEKAKYVDQWNNNIELPNFKWPKFKNPEAEGSTFSIFTEERANFITSSIYFKYIGTSLNPVSSDFWELIQAGRRRQRIYPDDVIKLGDGTITTVDLDHIVDNSNEVFNELVTNKYIDVSGNILQKFKLTIQPSDLDLESVSSCDEGKVYSLLETLLGYTIGSAPFSDVSSDGTGKLNTKYRWIDSGNALVSVKKESYDYIDFVKKVAELEYKKMSNINGDISPKTTCNINMTVDAFLYFNLDILTRLNIDNTTSAGIYDNNNGFPVSIKGITITASDRRVTIQADNIKSKSELEAIDGEYPCKDDQEYITEERRIVVAPKSDMKTRLTIV